VLLVLGLALLAGGVYVAAYLGAGDKVAVGTRVGGVDIGGHTPASAVVALRNGLAARADTPFTVHVNGRTEQVRPHQVGLDVDYTASVRATGAGRSWSPSRLWAYYTGGDAIDPVVVLDQGRLAALVDRLDLTDGSTATDGGVVFHVDGFTVSPPRAGLKIDVQAAGSAFWGAYLSQDPTVQLPLAATPPVIDAASIQRFVHGFANPAMASAVVLHLGRSAVRLQPSAYGHLLGSQRVGHRLRPTVDAAALAQVVASRTGPGGSADAPKDATVALVNGRPHLVKARPGKVFTPRALATALVAAIRTRARAARVHATPGQASFTDADARALGIRRPISSFTVRGRSPGLRSAAARIDGTLLRPGQSLSLRARLGGDVPATGAATALATATFNAAWLGGFPFGSHATLRSYSGDFPMGRDATLGDGQDLTFIDNTSYGVLVAATVHGGSLTVTLWSTPRWTVTSGHDTPTNVVPSGRVVHRGKHCLARAGRTGFDVTVTRTFARLGSGTADHSTSYAVHYAPVAAVVCRGH
jgi:hypothetical protein